MDDADCTLDGGHDPVGRPGAVEGDEMNPRSYVDLKETSRGLEPTYHFMINCLLYSRMETGLVSNQDFYDEDVNVYLAHLLHSFLNPEYVEQSRKYLSKYDADVFRRLQTSTDARLKYAIYKTNADFLLISIGIFDQPVSTSQAAEKPKPAEEAYVGRGKTYYHFAYSYSQQIHRRNSGISEVLEKLSVGFDKYLRILSHMRGEYLDLGRRLSEGEVFHLERTLNEAGRQEKVKEKQDQLLELYSAWRAAPSSELEEDMERVVGEIRELSPGFRFELPQRNAAPAESPAAPSAIAPSAAAASAPEAPARETERGSRSSSKLAEPRDEDAGGAKS
jgi:hypothetical protein